jgi:hypothetical protein
MAVAHRAEIEGQAYTLHHEDGNRTYMRNVDTTADIVRGPVSAVNPSDGTSEAETISAVT